MALLKTLYTVPEIFEFLTEEYSKTTGKFLMHKKVQGKYEGITYNEFKEETENFAFGLAELGVSSGDKIAIISENRPEWVYSNMAIMGLGGIDVPMFPSLTSDSIEFILRNSESRGVIVSNKFQLNKILKIKKNTPDLKFIIVLNEKDIEPNAGEEGSILIYTFNEVKQLGIRPGGLKETNPSLFKEKMKAVKEDDLCTIIYTSGTTGEPKGVMLTHKNILSNVNAALEVFPITKEDIFLSFLPLCHSFERMAGYYTAFSAGCTVYFAESIETVAQNLVEAKPTIITTVPRLFERMYSRILKNVESKSKQNQKIFWWAINIGKEYARSKKVGRIPIGLSIKRAVADKLVFKKLKERTGGNLRFFLSGAAPLNTQLGEFFEAAGIIILEGYGLTETSPVISVNRLDDYKFGTVGKVLPRIEVKIAPDGEILARGPNIMQGYFNNKKETEAVIKNGWLHTGDIGRFDSDGFLMITDRKKHLFKTSTGKYIAPSPIENLFLASKYIDQFVLIGDRRTFLTALIVPDFEAIKEYADSHKIPYKDGEQLTKKKEIYELMEKEMASIQKKLAGYERIRKFTLLDHPFTLETGEITPNLKIRRKIVEDRYQNLIEEMYAGE